MKENYQHLLLNSPNCKNLYGFELSNKCYNPENNMLQNDKLFLAEH